MSDSLFGLADLGPKPVWKSTPITRESLLRGAAALRESWERQRRCPHPRVHYGSRADVEQMAADFESDPAFKGSVRINRDAEGRVTSIEW